MFELGKWKVGTCFFFFWNLSICVFMEFPNTTLVYFLIEDIKVDIKENNPLNIDRR